MALHDDAEGEQPMEVITVHKSKFLQIRITDTLKQRYEKALHASGITKSDHLNSTILRYVEDYEKKAKKAAPK